MSKIDDIIQSGRAPGFVHGVTDADHSAARKVPKALREVESEPIYKHGPARGAGRIAKHFGMSTEFIKKAWSTRKIEAVVIMAFLWHSYATAGDITPGYNFVDGQTVSAANFNQQVGSATINSSFLSGKSVDTTPVSSDYFVTFSPTRSSMFRLTLQSGFLGNPNLITAQSEKGAPGSNDFILAYDTAGASLVKVKAFNLTFGNSNGVAPTIVGYPFLTDIVNLFQGTNGSTTLSNVLAAFTTLPTHTAPTNADKILIWDSANNALKQINLASVITNAHRVITPKSGDFFPLVSYESNDPPVLSWVGGNDLFFALQAGMATIVQLPQKFASITYPLAAGATVANTNHSLASTPQSVRWVLVCSTNDVGFVPGDEVDVSAFYNIGAASLLEFVPGANATNVFLAELDTSVSIHNKTNGTSGTIVTARWKAKCYATLFP